MTKQEIIHRLIPEIEERYVHIRLNSPAVLWSFAALWAIWGLFLLASFVTRRIDRETVLGWGIRLTVAVMLILGAHCATEIAVTNMVSNIPGRYDYSLTVNNLGGTYTIRKSGESDGPKWVINLPE